jgi:MFS family permease
VVVKRAFVSLSYPNYRLWFTGQLISMTGTWMQNTAQAYLAFELTKSPAFLGMMAFAQGVPTWIFMIYAGAIVDRISRRQILIVSQIFMMCLAILMAFLTWLDRLQPWHILILASLTGVANSFDAPARQSLASELVEKKDLTNALALNGALFNLGSTVGPALAGIIYVVSGPIVCFVLNAVSFLAVLIALAKIKLPPKIRRKTEESILEQLKEGVVYAATHRVIGVLIFLAGSMSLFGISVVTIFPAWAVHQLDGDARVAGYLQAGRGLGAVLGALGVAYFASIMVRGRWIAIGALSLPVVLIGFSLSKTLVFSLIFVALLGVSQIMLLNLSNSLIHSEVDDRLRGRVASIFGLTFFGLMPIGGLIMGQLAETWSEPFAVVVVAILFAGCAFGALFLKSYVKAVR